VRGPVPMKRERCARRHRSRASAPRRVRRSYAVAWCKKCFLEVNLGQELFTHEPPALPWTESNEARGITRQVEVKRPKRLRITTDRDAWLRHGRTDRAHSSASRNEARRTWQGDRDAAGASGLGASRS